MKLSEFKSFPTPAKRLIIYYTIGAPLLFTSTIFPIYLFLLGYTVEEVGFLYTTFALIGALITFAFGNLLDRKITPKNGIIAIELMGASASFIYAGARSSFDILLGGSVEKISSVFFVAYQVYEKDAYPEEIREKVFAYHMAFPQLAVVLTYPIVGYLLSYVFTSILSYRLLYFIDGALAVLLAMYVYKCLPNISKVISFKEKDRKGEKLRFKDIKNKINRQLLFVALGEIFVVIGFAFAPGFILANYIYNILGFTVFYFVLLDVISGGISALASMIVSEGDKKLRFKMIYGGIIMMLLYSLTVYSLQFLKFSAFISLILLFSATVILEFGHTFYFIYERAYLYDSIPTEYRGTILGTINSVYKIVAVGIPALVGFIASRFGALTPFFFQLIIFLCALIFFFLSSKNKRSKNT
ncbi:MAG: MFS transporter [Candidatus Njordarchaeia archaeon]